MADAKKDVLELYARTELSRSRYIRRDSYEFVLQQLLMDVPSINTGSVLTAEEKKDLGLNPRRKITKEIVGILNNDGLRVNNPSAIFPEIWYAIRIKMSRHENIQKFRSNPFTRGLVFTGCLQVDSCPWCRSNQDVEFPACEDIEGHLEENCKCLPYCKGFVMPVLDLKE